MEIYSVVLVCVMVWEGVGVFIVNLLIVLDYIGVGVNEGVCIWLFSVDIFFIISLI